MKTPPLSPRQDLTWTSPLKSPTKPPESETVKKIKKSKAACRLFTGVPAGGQPKKPSFASLFETKTEGPLINLSLGRSNLSSPKIEPTFESLSKEYSIDFIKPPTAAKGENFFEVRELVKEIESHLYRHTELKTDLKSLKERIYQLLHNKKIDHATKMGELGLILFYLDHPQKPFPENDLSLIAFRAQEIEKELFDLVSRHEKACTNKLIPSGKTHYLQRAFAHQAITSDQIYNKGGLYALLKILQEPTYRVSTYLRAEHYDHILIVTRQVLANGAFEGLFQRKIDIHPTLQDAIRIDLKLDSRAKVQTTHFFWDCFMFLFSDIRQIDRPNCYAIGALIYASENAPFKVIETLVSWLNRGHFSFNDHLNIPIFPLLEKRLIYTFDLKVKLPSQHAFSLTTFKHITKTLKVDINGSSGSEDLLPLQTSLEAILEGGEASAQLPYAEKLYYAYKYNTLAHLMLAVIEFNQMNTPRESDFTFSPQKTDLIKHIIGGLIAKVKDQFPRINYNELVNLIGDKWGEKFWFENCSEIDVSSSKGVVYVGNKKIEHFKGDPQKLASLYRHSLRVFYLENGSYGLVDSISDLQNALCSTLDEVAQKRGAGKIFRLLKKEIRSFEFRKRIAKYSAGQISQKGISWDSLNRADLFLFEQIGGLAHFVLDKLFHMKVVATSVSGATTPYQFIDKLLEALKKLDTTLLKSAPRILVRTCGSHLWTQSPDRLRLLFESSNDSFFDFIQRSVFDSANSFMRSSIPEKTIQAIIDQYAANDDKTLELMEQALLTIRYLTYEGLRTTMLDKVPPKRYEEAKELIDEEFNKIDTCQIDLQRTCKILQIDLPHTTEERVRKDLGDVRRHPYQIAYQLRKLFIQHNFCVIDPYDLEIALSYAHHLPIAFDIGDLNWDEGEYREDPPHPHLVIRYNWADRTLAYYERMSERETKCGKKEFERFEILHPAVKSPVKRVWN